LRQILPAGRRLAGPDLAGGAVLPGVGAEFVSVRIAMPFFPTMFVNLRGLDLGYAIAMSAQAAVSACARDLQVPGPVL